MHLTEIFGTLVIFIYVVGIVALMILAPIRLRRDPARAYEDACCRAVLQAMAEAPDGTHFSETDPNLIELVYAIPVPRMMRTGWINPSKGRRLEDVFSLLVMEEYVLAVEAMPLEGGPPRHVYRLTPLGQAWLASQSDA